MAKNVSSNPGRAFDLAAKIATPAVSKISKQAHFNITRIGNVLHHWKGSLIL